MQMLRLWVLSVVLPCAAQSSPSPTPAQALIVTSPLDNVYVYDDEMKVSWTTSSAAASSCGKIDVALYQDTAHDDGPEQIALLFDDFLNEENAHFYWTPSKYASSGVSPGFGFSVRVVCDEAAMTDSAYSPVFQLSTTQLPTVVPTRPPSPLPSRTPVPSSLPTISLKPSSLPTAEPTPLPYPVPSVVPVPVPTSLPVPAPSQVPVPQPSPLPTPRPTPRPSTTPSLLPTAHPTMHLAAVGGSAGWAIAGWTAGSLVFLAVVAFVAVAYRTHLAEKWRVLRGGIALPQSYAGDVYESMDPEGGSEHGAAMTPPGRRGSNDHTSSSNGGTRRKSSTKSRGVRAPSLNDASKSRRRSYAPPTETANNSSANAAADLTPDLTTDTSRSSADEEDSNVDNPLLSSAATFITQGGETPGTAGEAEPRSPRSYEDEGRRAAAAAMAASAAVQAAAKVSSGSPTKRPSLAGALKDWEASGRPLNEGDEDDDDHGNVDDGRSEVHNTSKNAGLFDDSNDDVNSALFGGKGGSANSQSKTAPAATSAQSKQRRVSALINNATATSASDSSDSGGEL